MHQNKTQKTQLRTKMWKDANLFRFSCLLWHTNMWALFSARSIECALNVMIRPCSDEPVLWKYYMVLTTMLQLELQYSYSFGYRYVDQHVLFFMYPQRLLGRHNELPVTVILVTGSSTCLRARTPNWTRLLPQSHLRTCYNNESHDTGEGKWLVLPNLET